MKEGSSRDMRGAGAVAKAQASVKTRRRIAGADAQEQERRSQRQRSNDRPALGGISVELNDTAVYAPMDGMVLVKSAEAAK